MHMDRDQDARASADAPLPSDRFHRRRFGRQCLVALLSLLWGIGIVQAATYYYDSNGQLVVITRNDGTSARYVYDDLGNLKQIATIPAGQLSIFGFTPNHGPIGTSVAISGQGFSAVAANDTVTFNGVVASIVSATANTLVTTVPMGATTGSVTVTVGSNTAASAEAFVVDANGAPPVIASVTPAIVAPGANVTIAGQYLDPVPEQTSVALSGQAVATASMNDIAISFVAPQTVGSGRVTVKTPFGLASSATDVIVVPTAIGATTIGAAGRIDVNSTQALTIPPSKNGVLLFDAGDTTDHNWLSFQLNALTGVSYVAYYVYDPRNGLVASGTLSASSPSLHLPRLTKPGTYSLYLEPSSSSPTTSLTLGLEANPKLALNANTPTSQSAVVANQSKRYIFQASPGVDLAFSAVVTNPAGKSVNVSIRTDYGVEVLYTSSSASNFPINVPFLITGNTYQAIVSPTPSAAENVSVTYQQEPGAALTIDGPTVNTTVPPGVNAFYEFKAAAGDNLELALSGLAMSPSGNYSDVYVYDPSGNIVASNLWCAVSNPASSCQLALANLVAGTYAVTVRSETAAATLNYQMTLTRDITGTLVSGQSQAFNLTRPGQSLRLGFTGNAGDTVALGISHIATIPAGKNVAISVLRPDGTTLFNSAEFSADSAINLPDLLTAGTYTVLVRPDYGLLASLQLLLAPNAGGTLIVDGPSESFSAFVGQNAYFLFTAATGDNLELGLSALTTTTTSCTSVNFAVYDSNSNYVTGGSWSRVSPGSSANTHLWGLVSGSYSVVLSGCLSTGTVTLTRDITGSLATGQTLSFNAARPGQTVRLSFAGTAGQTLAVALSNLATTPSSQYVTFQVFKPDGTSYIRTDSTTASTFNLPNLPVTGVYTIVVSPDYGLPASFEVSLLAQVGGTLTVDGPSQSVATTVAGQNGYFAFTAASGDNLELGLSGLTVNGSSCVGVNVYNTTNSNINSTTWSTSSPGASAHISLGNLAGGAYTIVFNGCGGATAYSGMVTLTRDLTGVLALGSPQSLNLARAGQSARLSFTGMMGQTLAVALNNPVTTPSGKAITFKVLKPDGSQYFYSDSASATLGNLPNLSVTGTYTVIVSPDYGLPATAQVSLLPQAGGPLTVDGASQAISTAAGQNAYFAFTAAAGDNLELGLSGLAVNGASSGCVNVYVYDPQNNTVGSVSWSTSNVGGSAHLSLWNLVAGTYTGTITDCTANESFNGTLTLTRDVAASLIAGNPLAINLPRPGQTERLSLSGTAGQTLTATLSNVVTTPSGQNLNFWIIRPDGTQWTSGGVSGNKVTLSNLPTTGTYNLIFDGYYGVPVSMTVLLQ
ncbi:beta strand repeat-containing protein [Rhodanobacter sp. Col0626]|uniref:beta strand repeat-containing protein n=1 Tax=Rhodanobacter sp. Col0626 TaxID=3415679 RepID=UPI003CEDFDF0